MVSFVIEHFIEHDLDERFLTGANLIIRPRAQQIAEGFEHV